MRLVADFSTHGYRRFSKMFNVWLDGRRQPRAAQADEATGEVWIIVRKRDGAYTVRKLTGQVEIKTHALYNNDFCRRLVQEWEDKHGPHPDHGLVAQYKAQSNTAIPS